MEVIFEIEYRTEWGQRLVWCSGERRIAMEYRSDGVWRCRTTLAAGDVEYGYEVEADGRTIRREWRPHPSGDSAAGRRADVGLRPLVGRPTDALFTPWPLRGRSRSTGGRETFDEGRGGWNCK